MTIVKSFLRRSKSGKMVRVRAHRRDEKELKRAMKSTKVFIGADVKVEKASKNLGRKEILVPKSVTVLKQKGTKVKDF